MFLLLSLSLSVMLMMAVSGKCRLRVLEPIAGVDLRKKVFTSRVR
jgi:hypothetical protein